MIATRHALRKADASPPDPRAIARIAAAWSAVAHAYVDIDVLREMFAALQRRDVNAALNALPDFRRSRDERAKAAAHKLMRVTSSALVDAFRLSADAEYKRVGSSIRVAKAAKKKPQQPDAGVKLDPERPRNRFVDVPHDDAFIFERSAALVADIGDEQRDNLRQVLAMRFDPDVRPENIIRDIKWVVGLTERESAAVFNREDSMREAGVPEARLQRETQRYSDQLHRQRAQRIARTETVAIETAARDAAWKVARADGLVDDDAEKEWVARGRACEVCGALDGERVPLDGHFKHPETGEKLNGPPAHPSCMCVSVLRSGGSR